MTANSGPNLRSRNKSSTAKVTDKTEEIANTVKEQAKRTLTVAWSDLPSWQQDNHYIRSGYRPATNSYRKSAASLGYIHNETVNVYTHLIGALAAVLASFFLYGSIKPRYAHATREDVLVFACFFGGATACLGMSATYHLMSNHSERVNNIGNQLDYVGIVALIWGSFIPSIYYGFSGEPGLVDIYWTMITALGVGCAIVTVLPRFRTPQWRPFRAGMFVAMGLSAVVPVLHGLKLYGVAQLERQIGLSWLLTQGALYIVGAGLYAARFPERLKPGAFDIWGSSHQIFHVLVVLAAAAHLVGLLKAYDYEHSYRQTVMSAYGSLKQMSGN
ncbi:hypothetical protein M8818_007933 [Zalaria obscura]|uniref:Uncharacterized protein n=1 Tax=Zalaria obscura TaxID=2024903 RepID=A0ACC3S2X7_9PEZI